MLETATHVLRTSDEGAIEVLSFNTRNDMIARIPYETRQGAIKALERLTGRRVSLKPMQTQSAERAEIGAELEGIDQPDE